MKRILHLVLALAVVLLLSACAARNNGGNNRVGTNNNGTDMQRLNQENTNNVSYRDGIYTGYGNPHANGNDVASVVIRNGRIADIDLINVAQQEGVNKAAGTGGNNQTGTGTTTPGTTGWGTTGPGYVRAPGNPNGNTTDKGMGTRIGTTGGIDAEAIDDVRTRLVNAMIRDQRYDVNIDNVDTVLAGTVDNWKLAVRRALDQAR